jgi:uncharacterized protein (DUF924 family)
MIDNPTPADIIAFWREAGPARWFKQDDAFDECVRNSWLNTHEAAARDALEGWRATHEGALALIILLDQFPRNMFRGEARAFATDAQALAVAREAIAQGFDAHYQSPMRRFFYLPAMHSEALGDQDFCLDKCRAADDADGVKFAEIHRDIIARFGRFPHRNKILGRETTPAEQAFLDNGGFAG